MTWTKFSDDYTDRPELLEVSRSARHLLTELYVWSNRMLTDGRIPTAALPRLTDSLDLDGELLELERAGLVTATSDRRAWQLDWTDQLDKTEVESRREGQKIRKERSRRHLAGDHSQCLPTSRCTPGVTRDRTRDEWRPSQPPDPTRPARRSRADLKPAKRCPTGALIAPDGACCESCAQSRTIPESA